MSQDDIKNDGRVVVNMRNKVRISIARAHNTPTGPRFCLRVRPDEVVVKLQSELGGSECVPHRSRVACTHLAPNISYSPPSISSFQFKGSDEGNMVVRTKRRAEKVTERISTFKFRGAPKIHGNDALIGHS